MQLTSMTELDAVNLMLSVIGEAPVNSIEVPGLGDVAVAFQVLNEVSREVQEKGWTFNIENNYPLALSVSNEIEVPPNALRVDAEDSEGLNVTVRGNRLYDRENHTYTFSNPVKCQITFMLAFTDLPQAARYYIAIRAARKFQKRVLGSDKLEAFTQDDEMSALVSLQDQDADVGDYNILTGNSQIASIHLR